MKLKEFLPYEETFLVGNENVEILGLSYDSRKTDKGFLFFALSGHNTDGKKYVDEVRLKGAAAVVVEREIQNCLMPQIVAKNIKSFMAYCAAKFYDNPDKHLTIIAITGTNGKTTISYLVESILKNSKVDCGVIGTINYRYKNKIMSADNTTPQSLDIYKFMRELCNEKIKYLIMEVSSHSLMLERVKGIEFDCAVWTNLTQDHLDFHKNMENYFLAKSLLFTELKVTNKGNKKYAVINADDKYGKKLLKFNICANFVLYSIKDNKAAFKAENVKILKDRTKFNLIFENKNEEVILGLVGIHNIYNVLAAFSAAFSVGIPFEKCLEGLRNLKQVPGRLEKVDIGNLEFQIVVDYAHTEDALKNVLTALRELKPKKLITVFGCGGDRDRMKRALMGKAATKMSDFVFVTSDNPRTEDPETIILDIEFGIKKIEKSNYKVIVDREMAIKEAVDLATKNDIVLIAGKGHENYQIIGKEKIHFDDTEVARKYAKLKEEGLARENANPQGEFNF
ncbi:MAG: UDP-N-acetylmuramoyl-L-alanyl-D-glutamate--2,6-diaminopimelate ligase [Elusimicrobiota bacterium]|jgi:UDP-N-acetylmuramoyl-L-alanyl-D-glutamate--2,6-diaminopimelate ligase|nr:UDP-N-acetylmuramoyl-L-alanyl-D-glutamate--2,6-diaminopimelate ligase [Elusimicrobiota bacterium]